MTMHLGIALALACACATQLAFLFRHLGANAAPAVDLHRPLRSGRGLFSSRVFAIGMLIAAGAWLLHVAALVFAPLSVVQAVLSTGVVILAVLAQRLFDLPVGRRQWVGVGMTAVGLVMLIATLPGDGGSHHGFSVAGMVAFESVLLVLGLLLVNGPRMGAPHHHHGVMLGAAAGVLIGVSDVAVKALTGAVSVGALIASPWLPLAGAASVLAFFASAQGMQQGDAVPVIASTSTAANVSCILGGILVFGDPLPGDPLGIGVQVVAFALVALAALLMPAPVPAGLRARPAA